MSIKFSRHIEIHQSPEYVFDYTQDYTNRLTWDTFLIEAYLLDEAITADKGVRAWCVAKNGLGMETEYVSFNRPRVTAIKMTRGPYLFKTFAGSWTFRQNSPLSTDVIFVYSFSLLFPYNLIGFIFRFVLSRNVRQRLLDLKKCIEQRQTVQTK